MDTIDLSMVSGYVPGVTDPGDMVPLERTNTLQDAFAWMDGQQQRKAANERLSKLSDYALLGHNAEWDAQHADLKNDSAFSHLTMDELNADDRDLLLGSELADTFAKGDTWGAAECMAEMLPAEQREAYLSELRGCEKETDMFRLMGRRFRADTRGAFDRQQAWAAKNEALAQRWAAGDEFDDTLTEADVDAMIMPMKDSDYDNLARVRDFMRDYVRPLEQLDDYEEAMRRLDGMEDSLLELIGDDAGSKDRADMVTQTLMQWAQKMAQTNRANEWNEVEVAVGKMLSNWLRFNEQSVLQQLSTSNYLPMGAPSMPVLVEASDNTKQWAADRNANRDQRDKARGTLRLAVDEAMKAESAPWYRKTTRGAASMFGETLPYLLPNGMLLGTTNLMTGGAYEQYTKNLAQGMESGEAFVNAYEVQGLNATVEALPWNRAISRIGGTGLNATFGRFLRDDIKKGIKPGWLTRRVAAWSSKGVWRAAAAETLGSFVDEGVLEPLAQGFLQYGTDHALDMLGVKHGETKGFWDDFDELQQIWTDPTQLGALMLFSAAMTGAYTPQIKKQVEYFAANRNFWITQGLTEKQADEVVTSENPWEEGRKVVNEEWAKDADGMRQRRLDNNRTFAQQGGVLVLTGAGSSDPDLNPGGMVDRAAAAVWQDYVDRGILPQVERTAPGKVRLTRKDGSSLELTDENADVYLLQQLQQASIDETRKLQQMMGGKAEAVNLRQEIANSLSTIAGRAGRRAVEQTSAKTGIEYEDVLDGLPSEIRAKVEAAGGITYAIAEEISQYAMGQIDEAVAGGATLDEARNMVGQMGRMRSLGTWADFARDFAARAKAGNIELQRARTNINRSSTRYRKIDGKRVLGQVLMGNGGTVNHYGILEDLTESFADQMLDERAQALQAENEGMSYGDARAQALNELHGIVKAARDAVLKADPKARIENMGETPNYTEVVEALSTMALSQFATGNAVPAWMRGLSSALAANLQMAADVNMVRAAYANALKSSPDALEKMEQLLDKLGVQVRDVMREAQITEADIQAWKNSAGVAQARADGPMGSGGASVSNVVQDAEQEEQDIAEREKEEPVQESEPTTGKDLQDDFERTAEPLPEDTVPENMRGVFTSGCVFNAAGGYFVGLIDKTKLRDGTEQVKKGTKGKHGVIAGRELTGNFQASAAPLYVWKRKNGELQVISGRHRFELMLRDDTCTAHLCYVFEENEEHNETWARMTDYENNMRDDQADELTAATYVRETGYSDEVLRQKGLLRNASRSKRGALIGREARQDLWDRFNSGAISAKDAEIICNLTKNIRDAARIEDIQARCCQLLEQKKSWEYIGAMVQLMANKEAVVMKQGLLDLGADFEADLNRAATWIEKNLAKINEAITLLKQGRKMSEQKRAEAERLGISVATDEGTQEMLQLLNDMKSRFEFIGSYPDLVAQAALYDGESEVDPVGQMLEQAQRDRAEMAEENAMSDDELLEKRNREIAAQSVPSLFQMGGNPMPKMTRKQIERMIDGLKQLSENERTMLKQLIALDNGAEAAVFNSIAMGGNVQLRQGNENGGLIHMLNRREESGLTPLEAKLVVILACFAAAKGEITGGRQNKREIEHLGVRAIVAKDSPDSMPMISGYVIDEQKVEAVAPNAALMPRSSYALKSLARDLPMGAAFTDVVAWFARFVKTNRDWEAYLQRSIMELKAIQDGIFDMDWSGYGSTFSMDVIPAGSSAVNLDDYFLPLQEGEQDMPIGLLRTLKNEPRKSIEKAMRFMAMAARGETEKRAAVAVAQNADGTYTIVDGDATSRALAELGAEAVRVRVVGPDTESRLYNSAYLVLESRDGVDADGEMRTHGLDGLSGESALNRAFEQAKENIAPLREIVEAAAKKVGGEAMMSPANDENNLATKKPSTARDKANRDYKGDISRVVDLIGGTCVLPGDGDFYDALKAIRKALPDGASIAKVKKLGFKTMAPMYRDIKVSVRFANGGIGEIILVEDFINDAKFNRGGHNIYDVTRELEPYENESAVETALKELDALSSLVYQRGVSAETLERAKALASSALEALQPSLKNFALSSGVIGSIKSPDSLSKHIKPASVLSAATPRVSLIQNISTDNVSPANGGVNNNLRGPSSFQMTDAALGALDILRGRENEVEGTRLITAWQEIVDAWTEGKGANKLKDGYRKMAEIRSLIAATKAVLPEKYARMGNLRMLLQWAEVYSTMADEGEVPMSGTITNPIFEKVRQRWAEQDELNRLQGLTDEEARAVFREVGNMRLEHALRKVAFESRTRLERWLKDKERERIETLIERAYPKREAGRKSPRGKMAAETYKYVEKAHELMDTDTNDVADIIDANKLALQKLDPNDADYEKRQEEYENAIYMATLYGDWDGKSLDDARRAATELTQLITEGRRAWADKLKSERNHTRWLIKSITKNFKVKPGQSQNEGAKKQIAEGAKRTKQVKSVFKGMMSFAQLMLAMRPVLGKTFCDRMRRMLAEHHVNTMRFNNELREWMFTKLRDITGLQTEDKIQVWLNELNQEEHTGIRLQMPVKHGVVLEIEEARRWVNMSREEREAERKRLAAENDAKEQDDPNIPTEEHIEELRGALARYDEGARWAAMTEEEREAEWVKVSEGKSAEWKKENNPGLMVARANAQKFVKAETTDFIEQDEIVATKEGILYTLLLLEQDDYTHLKETNGLNDDNINALYDYIGPEVLEWGHAMRDKLIEQGKDMRTFYEEYTGVPLPSNPRYFPGAFEMEASKSNKEAPDQQGGAGGGITGGKMGCLIARRKHNRKFDWMLSASAMFRNAMQQQFNYVSVTPITRELRTLLNDAEFSRRLKSELGPDMVRQLTAWVEVLEGAIAQDSVIGNQMSRIQRALIQMYAISRLAGNVYTWVKQSSGVIHGFLGGYIPDKAIVNGQLNERMTYHHIGFGEYISALGKCLARQNTITMEDVKKSDYIKQRINGAGRDLEATLLMKPTTKVAGTAGRWAKRNITDRAMDTMEDIDRNANAVSMLALVNAIYDRAMAENADGRVPEAAIKEMALQTAGMMLDIAAQPKVRTQKSLLAVGGGMGGAVGDFLLLFKSESLSKLGLAMAQAMGGEKGYALAGYATFGTFNALVLWAINWVKGQWGLGDDDKSKLEWWQKLAKFGFNAATGDLSAAPIIGDTVGMAESMLFGGWRPSATNLAEMYVPFSPLYTSIEREWKAVNRGKDGWDRHFQNVTNIIREAAACGALLPGVNQTAVTMSEILAAAATAANVARTGKDVVKKTLELAE